MRRSGFAVLVTVYILWVRTTSRCQRLSMEIISPGMFNLASLTSMPLTAPAIDIGLEEIKRNYSNLMDVNLVYLYNRSFTTCDEAATGIDLLVAEYYYRQRRATNLTIFMFPGCSWEAISVAKLTAGWNQLAIIGAFNDITLRDKTAYPNVIQAGPLMMRQIIATFVDFLTKYNWKTVYVVYDKAGKSAAIAAAGSFLLEKTLKKMNGYTVYSKVVNSSQDESFDVVLREIEHVARIVAFWGHADNLRKFMIAAHRRSMTRGDYVYMTLSPFEYATPLFGNTTWEHSDPYDEISFKAYRSLFVVTATSSGPEATQTRRIMRPELVRRSAEQYNYMYQTGELPVPHVYTQYACMYMIGKLLKEIATGELSHLDRYPTGDLAKWFWDKSFDTPVGQIKFDSTGERQIQLEVRQFNSATGVFTPFLRQNLSAQGQLIELEKLLWFTGTLPLDIPICGFSGSTGICAIKSGDQTKLILLSSLIASAVLVVFIVAVLLIARKAYSEIRLRSSPWEFPVGEDYPQLQAENKPLETTLVFRRQITLRNQSYVTASVPYYAYTHEQTIRSNLNRRKCMGFLHALLTMEHSNIVQFFGILITRSDLNCIYENCHRGCLKQLLDAPQITLDDELKNSLIVDLLQGLKYIHSHSVIKYHGYLNCATCAITNHFGLKISHTGLDWLVNQAGLKFDEHRGKGFHTAPDDRHGAVFNTDRKPIDIYAAGTICVEIILERAIHKSDGDNLAVLDGFSKETRSKYGTILRNCFDKDPLLRPTVKQLFQGFSFERKKQTVIERLLQRLSKYSTELEYLVGIKTQELLLERSKCDELLSHLLPASIVESLRMEEAILPQLFDAVTMMFSDIAGFVQFVATKSPYQVIQFLNYVHGMADGIISDYNVYKVETIGDTYFIVSGLPVPNGAKHVYEICTTAAALSQLFSVRIRPSHESMSFRIGIHSGSCVASVIGIQRPRYCL